MKLIVLSYAFPPISYARSIQVGRLLSNLPWPQVIYCGEQLFGNDSSMKRLVQNLDANIIRIRLSLIAELIAPLIGQFGPRWDSIPDRFIGWSMAAAQQVLRDGLVENDDLLITFGQPMSDHLAGLELKRKLGLRWIVHFSDPWVDNHLNTKGGIAQSEIQKMEGAVIAAADRIVFTSEETAQLVMAKYPHSWLEKVKVLYHCFDRNLMDSLTCQPNDSSIFVIRHIGELYGSRSANIFLGALELLNARDPSLLRDIRFEFFGRRAWREVLLSSHSSLNRSLVKFMGPVDYITSLEKMKSANCLLVIDANVKYNVFFPSKLVEYFGAGRPILAITPPGTTSRLLERFGGLVCNPKDMHTLTNSLELAIKRLKETEFKQVPSPEIDNFFEVTAIAKHFDQIIRELVR